MQIRLRRNEPPIEILDDIKIYMGDTVFTLSESFGNLKINKFNHGNDRNKMSVYPRASNEIEID